MIEFWSHKYFVKSQRTYSAVYIAASDRSELRQLLNLSDCEDDTRLWRLTDYLLFGTSFDDESGALLLDHYTLATIADRSHRSGSFRAYKLLEEYQSRTGIRMEVSYPNAIKDKARSLLSVELPDGVEDLVQRIRRTSTPLRNRVALDTGKTYKPSMSRLHRLETKMEALELASAADNPDAIRLLNLLNEAPSNRWSQVVGHIPSLRELAEELPAGSRDYALNVLARVEVQPMPFFKPVDRTSRIYPIGSTVLGLPRELRKELLSRLGWQPLDLKSAQLAVVSKLWDVPELQSFLQSGLSVWAELLKHLGLPDEHKPLIKEALYALIFGESERKSKARLESSFPASKSLWRRWRSHPIIAALYAARKRTIAEYNAAGGAEDAYGRPWKIEPYFGKPVAGSGKADTNARAVMATVAQSYELKLLAPVIDIMEGADRRVQLCYWLHDGFALSISKNRAYLIDTMKAAVQQRAEDLGILTELVDE